MAEVPARRAVIPRATYRVQLNSGFTFKDATALVPYLAGLGISHLYCSPYFRARPGSVHGYDVVDHNSLNPEIGTREEFEQLVATLRAHGMGHILDFVPNHVGIMGAQNASWMHVLENGKASRSSEFFDIDWSSPNPALADKLLVPVLSEPYGTVLERGELQLRYEPELGSLAVFYFEHRFPLDPRTYPMVLEQAIVRLGRAEPGLRELESLAAAFAICRIANRAALSRASSASGTRRSTRNAWRRCLTPARRCAPPWTGLLKSSTARRATLRASTACMSCWSGSATAWPSGGWPRTTSTIAAFLT